MQIYVWECWLAGELAGWVDGQADSHLKREWCGVLLCSIVRQEVMTHDALNG